MGAKVQVTDGDGVRNKTHTPQDPNLPRITVPPSDRSRSALHVNPVPVT